MSFLKVNHTAAKSPENKRIKFAAGKLKINLIIFWTLAVRRWVVK